MQVIAINGSPRKKGNTATKLSEILADTVEKGAGTRLIHLNDLNLKGCQECLAYRENLRKGTVSDDSQDVLKEMKECDALGRLGKML